MQHEVAMRLRPWLCASRPRCRAHSLPQEQRPHGLLRRLVQGGVRQAARQLGQHHRVTNVHCSRQRGVVTQASSSSSSSSSTIWVGLVHWPAAQSQGGKQADPWPAAHRSARTHGRGAFNAARDHKDGCHPPMAAIALTFSSGGVAAARSTSTCKARVMGTYATNLAQCTQGMLGFPPFPTEIVG